MFGVEPDLTREGGSIPVTLTFQEATGKSVILLPIGGCDDGAHSQNEKINRSNYINGVRKFHDLHICPFGVKGDGCFVCRYFMLLFTLHRRLLTRREE